VSVNDERLGEYLAIQQQVKTWLEDSLGIVLAHDFVSAERSSLRNGIVLCFLLREIDPSSIPTIHPPTATAFQLRENIEFFLKGCKELGLTHFDRFSVSDLWYAGETVKIVFALKAMASMAHKKHKFNPLPEAKPVNLSDFSDEALASYREQLSKQATPLRRGGAKPSSAIIRRQLAYRAGRNVNLEDYEGGIIKFQALVRGYLQRKKYLKHHSGQGTRDKIAEEILSTERKYVNAMGVCIRVFLEPLETQKKLITQDEIRFIFSDIRPIHFFNTKLAEDLAERLGNWSPTQCIGDIFLKLMEFMKVYKLYVQNYSRSLTLLDKLQRKNPKFSKFLEECKNHPESGRLDLASFLIMPIQRIPRYELLLRDLLKRTWENHPDYKDLVEAREKIQGVGQMLNEKKREAENMTSLIQASQRIQGKLKVELTEPHRRFIREQKLVDGKDIDMVVFLFNDCLITSRPTLKSKISSKSIVKFRDLYWLKDIEVRDLADTQSQKNMWELSLSNSRKKDSVLRLFAPTPRDKEMWLSDLQENIDEQKDLARNNSRRERAATSAVSDKSAEETLFEKKLGAAAAKQKKQHGSERSKEEEAELIQLMEARKYLQQQIDEVNIQEPKDKRARRKTIALSTRLLSQAIELDEKIEQLGGTDATSAAAGNQKKSIEIQFFYPNGNTGMVSCPLNSTIDQVLLACFGKYRKMDSDASTRKSSDYVLFFEGNNTKYLDGKVELTDYAYVAQCVLEQARPEVGMMLISEVKDLHWLDKLWVPDEKAKKKSRRKTRAPKPIHLSPSTGADSKKSKRKSMFFRREKTSISASVDSDSEGGSSDGQLQVNKRGQAAPPRPVSGPPVCTTVEVPNTAARPDSPAKGATRSKPPPPSTPSPAALALQQKASSGSTDTANASSNAQADSEKDPYPGVSTDEHPTPAGEDEFPPPDTIYFSFAHLNTYPQELNRADLPRYLIPEDFKIVFDMEKAAFYKLPAWKQAKVKQSKALY